ncbi:MAG: transketolase [Nitrospiraceae bacterium]|nr:MAG: transketolase [Nitrospiraceae bacterium]
MLLSGRVRRSVLEIINRTGSPHIGSSFSIVEILVALYFGNLKVSPDDTHNPDRDRFILSKGHACATLYAVLAERGFLSKNDLEGFAVNGGTLEQHPNRDLMCGIEVSTGSLGHGLSIGAGMALAGKVDGKGYKVYVLMGDGELNEGSVWESIMFAGHHGLSNLVALVDCNRIQALGCTKDIMDLEPLNDKWKSFGWEVRDIDGHDFGQIFSTLGSLSQEKPNVIILHTVKGKGVSFMEDKLLWHYRAPDDDEYKRAIKELI